MISCTDFIFSYSELFSYIEENFGADDVRKYWTHLFDPVSGGIALSEIVRREGIAGCFSYWKGSLNEEAADFTMYLNEKRGYFKLQMHYCPSKGRLLEGCGNCGITPYRDYCLHCDCYRASIEQVGLKYLYDFTATDKACCSILIYDPKVFDGRVIVDQDTIIMDRRASDNPYFHQEFHNLLNRGIDYLAKTYGVAAAKAYLDRFAAGYYQKDLENICESGLPALIEAIKKAYEKEKCPEAVCFEQEGKHLIVTTAYCPAVKFIKDTQRPVSEHYLLSIDAVLSAFAKAGGYQLIIDRYDPETGGGRYRFENNQ